jgi:5,6,7,8-tetrahydromethanopterin hydro-lyase
VLKIGEGFEGSGVNAAHVSLLLGPRALLANAYTVAAASPGAGHVPFQVVLQPNLPVKPPTLFVAKAVLRTAQHERMTWGPAQAGVAAGITQALLQGVLPTEAETQWLVIALVWVDPAAEDADAVYHHNSAATLLAAKRSLRPDWPDRIDLAAGLAAPGNPFYTPSTR